MGLAVVALEHEAADTGFLLGTGCPGACPPALFAYKSPQALLQQYEW